MRPVIAKKMFGNFVKDCNKTLINSNKLVLYLFPTSTAPFRSGVRKLEEVQKRFFSHNTQFSYPPFHTDLKDQVVVWDYHVILVHASAESTQVYDLDTTLSFPASFQDYCESTFGSEDQLKESGVNKKPKKIKTVWHGVRGILKLSGRVNQASLKLSAGFSNTVCWSS